MRACIACSVWWARNDRHVIFSGDFVGGNRREAKYGSAANFIDLLVVDVFFSVAGSSAVGILLLTSVKQKSHAWQTIDGRSGAWFTYVHVSQDAGTQRAYAQAASKAKIHTQRPRYRLAQCSIAPTAQARHRAPKIELDCLYYTSKVRKKKVAETRTVPND